ncbi:MAG: ferredoxin [Acidimicrobiia bacterium]|jgi:ferredoxin
MAGLDVTVDHDLCVGSTMCTQFAEGVFDLNDEGQSVVTDPAGASREAIVDAASQCPMEAITVVDTATGERLFP